MKRLNLEGRLRLQRLSRFRLEARIKRNSSGKKSLKEEFVGPTNIIKAPKSFDLIKGSGGEVVRFIRAISNAVLNKKIQVELNFKETQQFNVPATILLYAEIDRIISQSDLIKPITIRDPFR